MSTLHIPVPTISTGPKHMTDTEAAEHYLREMRDRTKMLQAGSGVTALVNRLLDDVLDAMEALNTSTDTPTPERVTLSAEEERVCLLDSIKKSKAMHRAKVLACKHPEVVFESGQGGLRCAECERPLRFLSDTQIEEQARKGVDQ